MVRSIKKARANGSKGVIDNQWLVTFILGAMLVAIGFLAKMGYEDIRDDLAHLRRAVDKNCVDIAVVRERIDNLRQNCKRSEP